MNKDKTKEEIGLEIIPNWGRNYSYTERGRFEEAMQAYADQELSKVNEFIRDIAKLLGEDGLGFDGLAWTVDDFKEAIEQEKRKEAMAYMLWVMKEGYYVPNSNHPRTWCNGGRNEWPQMCYTDDELYDLYLQSLSKTPTNEK